MSRAYSSLYLARSRFRKLTLIFYSEGEGGVGVGEAADLS